MLKRWGMFWMGLACCSLMAGTRGAGAQQTVPVQPPAEGAAVGTPSTLTFDVVVTDKAGHPVTGLQASDFQLLDDKRPATIEEFAEHKPDAESPETALLAIDLVNEGFGGVSQARSQIMDLLRGPDGKLLYPVGLVLVTDSQVKEIAAPTRDAAALEQELGAQGGELRQLGRSGGFWGATERLQTSLNSLDLLVRSLARMRGRKLLIWVGPGWPIFDNPSLIVTNKQQENIFSQVATLSDEMAQGQVTLFAVDPLGTVDAGSFRTFEWESFVKPVRKWQQAQPGDLALQAMAAQSGGMVLNSSNDVKGELAKCLRDGDGWYTLTFAPEKGDQPHTWHDIAVKLDKAGLTVKTRDGYYGEP